MHYMDKPGFAALAAAAPRPGCVVITESARNVLHLKKDLQTEFARRVVAMAGSMGAVLVSSDRAISSDTYSVGTIIDVGMDKDKAKDKVKASEAAASDPAGIAVFPPDATPFLPAMHGGAAAAAAATGSSMTGLSASASASSAAAVPRRNKSTPFAAMAHAPLPHPAVAALLAASDVETAATARSAARADAALGGKKPTSLPDADAVAAAAAAAAARLEHAIASALPRHDPSGGDNPPPEALIFALLPTAAAQVRDAFLSRVRVRPGSHGGGSDSALPGGAGAGAAAGGAGASDSAASDDAAATGSSVAGKA